MLHDADDRGSRRHECRGSRGGVVSSPLRGLASDDLLVCEAPARGAGEPEWAIEHVIDAYPTACGHLSRVNASPRSGLQRAS